MADKFPGKVAVITGASPGMGLATAAASAHERRGAIILTGSTAAIKAFPGMSVYSATKAVVRSFARTSTNELSERRIRVNTISPGHIDTPIMESLQQGNALTRMKEEFAKAVPLGRMGDPDYEKEYSPGHC